MSRDFPISSEEDSFVTRREFTKFLGLTSLAFFAGTFVAAGRKLWKRAVAGRVEVSIGVGFGWLFDRSKTSETSN